MVAPFARRRFLPGADSSREAWWEGQRFVPSGWGGDVFPSRPSEMDLVDDARAVAPGFPDGA
eukprot:9882510-Lingulodinium_polyedra.AAC.1